MTDREPNLSNAFVVAYRGFPNLSNGKAVA
jgi:hypothetical protein